MKGILRFQEIQIERAPGFEAGGFSLSDLSPQLNLIHGPNGVGKTMTARALERLIWPQLVGRDRFVIRGRFVLSDADWLVEVDSQRTLYQRDGITTFAPTLPAMEDRSRYRLSLHDLLSADDADFAHAIVRESAGGYDVRAAGRILSPREKASQRSSERGSLRKAQDELNAAEGPQRELRQKELRVGELRRQKATAEEAGRRIGVLERALEYARASERVSLAEERLKGFDPRMDLVKGDEAERLDQLREEYRKVDTEWCQAVEARERALERVDSISVPVDGDGVDVAEGLERDYELWREAEVAVNSAKQVVAAAAGRLSDALEEVGGAVDEAGLAALDAAALGKLADLVRRADSLNVEDAELETALRLLGQGDAPEDGSRLITGIDLLQRWLRAPLPRTSQSSRSAWIGILAAGVLILLGAALGLGVHPAYLIVTLVGCVFLWLALRGETSVAADLRDVHRSEYQKLGLDAPSEWTPEAVEGVLGRLREREMAVRREVDRRQRLKEIEDRRDQLGKRREEFDADRLQITRALGFSSDADVLVLRWIAERAADAQRTQQERAGAEAALEAAIEQAERISTNLQTRLGRLGFTGMETVGEVGAAIQRLRKRFQESELAQQDLHSKQETELRLAGLREKIQLEIDSLFKGADLDPGMDETIRDLCSRHGEFVAGRVACREAGALLAEARTRLESAGASDALGDAQQADLEAQLVIAKEQASGRDDLASEITRLEEQIRLAKVSHDIEDALERVSFAEEALRDARGRDVRSVIAEQLLVHLEAATRDQNLPMVFVRARELFTQITRGRYELRLPKEGSPEFIAFDTVNQRGRDLSELSSGSRVQLLIAVRMAFVEHQEQGAALPLVLDEVLGNSDSERARAIMEAVLRLANEGRQIFYFTAQTDEIARWRGMAAEAGVKFGVVDLLGAQGRPHTLEIPEVIRPVRPPLSAPEGRDHAEYGRLLGVPRLNRETASVASTHLWYLVDDPEELHRSLLFGADRWGMFHALVRDAAALQVDRDRIRVTELYARATEAFLDAARVGYGIPVDRQVLLDSHAVSDTHLDAVDALARDVGGDGALLIDRLLDRQIPRFQVKRIERLNEYLEENGHIDRRPCLTPDEIRTEVLRSVAAEIGSGAISAAGIDRLLSRLRIGLGEVED